MINPSQAQKLASVLLTATDDDTPPQPVLGGRTFGNYRVSRLVGLGGMGEVYEALQERTGRRVAVKIIRPELLTADLSRRFEHEVRLLARLQHPGIAQVYEAGQVDTGGGTTPYFAMEYVEGRPLTRFAADQNFSTRERLELFLKVCDAVEHAHRNGIIHRDLKPANILVDSAGQPRILDFGVARATDADVQATTMHTDIGKLIGTLPYMSPEQVSGDTAALDTRSDVYSLGVILYELLAGKPPYEVARRQVHEAARVIKEQEPTPLGLLDRSLKGDLETILGKALEKEPDRRYQSVGELASDIRRHLGNEPISAHAPSFAYQLAKLARRHTQAVSAFAIAALAIMVAIVLIAKFAIAERAAHQQAEKRAAEAVQQSAIAEEVRRFMEDMIIAVAPQRFGRDAKVVDVLGEAARKLSDGPPKDPATEAAIRHAVGYAMDQLGDFEKAQAQLQRAWDLTNQVSGPESDDAVDVTRDLAIAMMDGGHPEKAEPLLTWIYEYRKKHSGEKDRQTLKSLNEVGECVLEQSQFARAEVLLSKCLDIELAALSPDDPAIDTARHNLAAALMKQEKLGPAEKIMRDVVASDRAHLGEKDPAYFQSYELLAGIIHHQGRPAEAETMFRDILARKLGTFGPEHLQVFMTQRNVASTLLDQHKLPEAETILTKLVQESGDKLGPSHQAHIEPGLLLCRAFAEEGRLPEAESLATRLVSESAKDGVPRLVGVCRLLRAKYLEKLGRHPDAVVEAEAALAALESDPASSQTRIAEAVEIADRLERDAGRPEKANEIVARHPNFREVLKNAP